MNKSVKERIVSALKYYRDCWEALAEEDNLYMLGRLDGIDTAIKIVKFEFDKAESEVEGE